MRKMLVGLESCAIDLSIRREMNTRLGRYRREKCIQCDDGILQMFRQIIQDGIAFRIFITHGLYL